MKKTFTLFWILFIFISFPSFSQWEWQHPKPSGVSWEKVYFTNSQKGVAIGGGQIIKTDNGGGTWKIIQQVSSTRDMDFSGSFGMVVGNSGTIYKTQNNGDSWQSLSIGIQDHFNRVSIINPDTIFLTSTAGKIYRTYDGGKSWKTFNPGIQSQLIHSVDFVNGQVAYMGLASSKIIKTVDGGETWTISHNEINISPSEISLIHFVNENIGFAFRGHGDFLKTTDGGKTWKVIASFWDKMLSIQFINESIGFMAGEHGAMWQTKDGGKTWTWMGWDARIYYNDILSVHFITELNGFAVGLRGRILKTIDGGKTWQPYSSTYYDINDINFPTNKVGYALASTSVLKTQDGGNTWVPLEATFKTGLTVGEFFDENTGIIGGSTPKLYKTYDGGKTWKTIALNQFHGLSTIRSMYFLNKNIGFICGDHNGLDQYFAKTIDGGETWEWVTSILITNINFLTEEVGFGSRYDILYKTEDGGKTWQPVKRATDEDIESIDFIDDKTGFMACENGTIEKTIDAGQTWTSMKVENQYYDDLIAIKFFDKNVGYLTGDYNSVFKTIDGGKTWSRDGYSYHLSRAIEFTKDNKVFLGGEYGAILSKGMGLESYRVESLSVKSITDSSGAFIANIKANYSTVDSIRFEYGINSFTNKISANPNFIISKTDTLKATAKGLAPNTKYNVRVRLYHNGLVHYSSTVIFTTLPKIIKHQITKLNVRAISDTSAVLSAVLSINNGSASDIGFEYGVNGFNNFKIANPISINNKEDTVKAVIVKLEPATNYKARLKFTLEGKVLYSDEITFITQEKKIITGIEDNELLTGNGIINVFPNPTSKFIYIRTEIMNKNNLEIELIDTKGKSLLKSKRLDMDLSGFSSGLYLLKIVDGKNIYFKKIVIK